MYGFCAKHHKKFFLKIGAADGGVAAVGGGDPLPPPDPPLARALVGALSNTFFLKILIKSFSKFIIKDFKKNATYQFLVFLSWVSRKGYHL